LDTKDPHYNVISSALSLERDALDYLYPDIADAPDVRHDYVMDEAEYSNLFPNLGQSSRVIARYSPHLVSRSGQMDPSSPPTRMVALLISSGLKATTFPLSNSLELNTWCSHPHRSR
jgi:hypothetical protein